MDRFGGERLDASLLLLPLLNFLPADEPRMSATIDAVERELGQDGLIWRKPHGGDTDEGAFIACTCWLADCRTLQGRQAEARRLLERVLSLRNEVGLLSEMYHPGLRRLIGNFPAGAEPSCSCQHRAGIVRASAATRWRLTLRAI